VSDVSQDDSLAAPVSEVVSDDVPVVEFEVSGIDRTA
jgi:hypothetical protein